MKLKIHNLDINSKRRRRRFQVSSFRLWEQRENGVTLLFTLIILTNVLLIVLAVGIFSLNQQKITSSARNSTYAIFAGTTGLEKAFYGVRQSGAITCPNGPNPVKVIPEGPEPTVSMDNGAAYVVRCHITSSASCSNPTNLLSVISTGNFRGVARSIEASWCQ